MKPQTKAYIALANISFFWGTTYLALRIGVKDIPPFLFSGIRQFGAGLLLFALMAVLGKIEKLSVRDVLRQCLPGIFLITFGNGIIGWAELYIPSGLAALIVSVMPIYLVIINLFTGHERSLLNARVISGFVLGCIGIVLIFRDNLSDLARPKYFLGVIASFGACLFWAIGSLYIKRNTFRTNSYSNAAIQFTIGGIGLFVFSLLFDDYQTINVTPASLWALVYLTLIGSVLAYLSYLYAIKHLPMVTVSTYAYINPVIAILLGVLILSEKMTWLTVVALVTTLAGVYLINTGSLSKSKIKGQGQTPPSSIK